MRLLLLSGIALAISTSAHADSANSDWNDSAGFASSGEMIVLMERFKLRQMIPGGFSSATNIAIGSITNNNMTVGDNSDGNVLDTDISTDVSGSVDATQSNTNNIDDGDFFGVFD